MPRADQLPRAVVDLFSIQYKACIARGLVISLDKSMALVSIRGTGSRRARTVLHGGQAPGVQVPQGGALKIKRAHKALGTMMTDNANWHLEVQSRVASMRGALTPVKKCARATSLLDIDRRRAYTESLALSRLAFNSGV